MLPNFKHILNGNKKWLLLDQIVFSASSFITTIILARHLSMHAFGLYSSVVIYSFLLLSISNALIINPFQALYAKSKNKQTYISSLFGFQIVIILILVIITLILLSGHLELLLTLKENKYEILLLIVGFILQDFFRKIFITLQIVKVAFFIDLISNIGQVLLLIYFSYLDKLNLQNGILIIGITYLPAIIYAIVKMNITYFNFIDFKETLVLHFSNGKWFFFTSLLQWWSNNFIVAISGILIGINALGALRLAQTLFGVLNALFQLLENYTLPNASLLLEISQMKMKHFLQDTTKKSFWVVLFILSCIALFSKEVFFLIGGSRYVEYSYIVKGMSLLYLIIFIGYPIRVAIRVMLMNRDFFMSYFISFVFTLIFAKYLIIQWQIMGVIISLIINQILLITYLQYKLIRQKVYLWK